ncbi:MAG: hypothetical protein R3A44_04390 [Caldilineaceae bacterium]
MFQLAIWRCCCMKRRGCDLLAQLRQLPLGLFNLAARLVFALNELELVHCVSAL